MLGSANTTPAPAYWATCGHVHPWGVACGLPSSYVLPHPDFSTQFERKFGPCPKCDNSDLAVTFHDGKRVEAHPGYAIPSCKHAKECGRDGKRGQHLVVHCRRCQFGWRERPGSWRERPPHTFGAVGSVK
jgi:hypothetical protein